MQTSPIVIIGGGVIGLAAAYELAKRNHPVLLLEKEEYGGQATGAAAGMLAPYSEIAEDPDDFFKMAHHSLQIYPKWQAEVKEVSGLDFEYTQSGSLYVVFHEADELALETRLQWQHKWGIESEIVRSQHLKKMEPHLTNEAIAAIYSSGEHHIYAPDYVKALYYACLNMGVQVIEHTGEVQFKEIRSDGLHLVTERKGSFFADQCIIANGAWTSFFEKDIAVPLPIFPIRGQICAYHQELEKVEHIVFSSQGYVLSKANGTIVCGASEDIAGYDTSVTEKGIRRLINWSRKLFPYLQSRDPFHRWAGLRPATQDGFPLIGRLANYPNIILSSGHYRNGILLNPINAKIIADIVEEKEPSVNIDSFHPNRF